MSTVIVETASLHRSDVGSVTGEIHLRLGSDAFPETGWSDFPIVILSWWIGALLALLRGESRSEDLQFMDGPLVVRLSDDGAAELKYRAIIRGGRDADVVLSGRLDGRALLRG